MTLKRIQTDPLMQFLAQVEVSRDLVRQRGIHPSFEVELQLFEQALEAGYIEATVQREGEDGPIHFFRARMTKAGELALQETGWVL